MNQTIVRDHVGHREDPVVARPSEQIRSRAGQRPPRLDQGLVDPMHPLDHRAGPGQVELRRRGAGQDARLGARGHQLAHRRRVQPHVGVEVDAREGPAGGVAEAQRVRLTGHGRFDHAYAGHPPRRLGGAVGTGVRDHDDVELARCAPVEQPAQVVRDDGFLVVRRYHDADRGLAHAGQDIRCCASTDAWSFGRRGEPEKEWRGEPGQDRWTSR